MKKKEILRTRVTIDDKQTIELASKMGDVPMSEIMRIGTLKEAKKILRDIEKGKKWKN